MSATTDREKALLIQLEVERLCKDARLPMVCIVACPDDGGCVRASLSIAGDPHNIEFFMFQFLDYMKKLAGMGRKDGAK